MVADSGGDKPGCDENVRRAQNQREGAPRWLEALRLLPQIGWLILGTVLLIVLVDPVVKTLKQSNITKLGVGVMQIEFAQMHIQNAASVKSQDIPSALKDRLQRSAGVVVDASILWVDDNPARNLPERRALASLGITIDTAKSTEEALDMLTSAHFDVLISDFIRDQNEKAQCFAGTDPYQPANSGCNFMRRMTKFFEERREKAPPLIFYTEFFDPEWGTPVYAFGVTNRVDGLFHLILDALERRGNAREHGA